MERILVAEQQETIAIVGGGIAGLFCAYALSQNDRSVYLFEASKRLGGRIRSIRLDKNNKVLDADWTEDELEFCAEFGPMRVELHRQQLLNALLRHLEIRPLGLGKAKFHLVDFPPYTSPASKHDPEYELRPDEEGKTPIQLLQMSMLKIMLELEIDADATFAGHQQRLIERVARAESLGEPLESIFSEWIKGLDRQDYLEVQTMGRLRGVPLYAMGFWNLLGDYLSHNAITKLRVQGTFYHHLPENPNAAEWLVWWLVGFADNLHGVFGGMESIIEELQGKLSEDRLMKNCSVIAVEKRGRKLRLIFDRERQPEDRSHMDRGYDRVIFALPRRPMQRIYHQSHGAFEPEPETFDLLDSVLGYPLAKVFAVVKNRWWEEENRANRYATRIPTRELHYWRGLTDGSRQGLIMAYTDPPATSFWSNHVSAGRQDDVAISEVGSSDLLSRRLRNKFVEYLNETDAPDIAVEDVVWWGIRDWGREPFRAGGHAWRPERKYWVVIRRLADVAASDRDPPNIHICGEAYSDYHGFIEGALRSAVYVLHRILDRKPDGTFELLPWLEDDLGTEAKSRLPRVDKKYLDSLRHWAAYLDAFSEGDSYMYKWE